ncbi:MAG: transposase [Okeania sp. SIO3B5]|uniref:hypothetical protein n=1 Tax=Okeania sp. SIO3B5 TaxID=2607811 RepID=UPI0013FF14F1|nr:hypothetical protein [Okeania sp. SIO3B5]NEO54634.1 transposase [Okeania sp. SIO3B5]
MIKIKQSRPYPEGFQAKQARIVKKATGYYLMITFSSSESVPENPVGERSLGIDAGIENFVATSTGKLVESPKLLLLSTAQADKEKACVDCLQGVQLNLFDLLSSVI